MPDLYLGIDIGGTKIAAALVTAGGEVLHREDVPTRAHEGGQHVLEIALDIAAKLVERPDADGLIGIGVGAGGQIDSVRGVVVSATDLLPGWIDTDIKGSFQSAFGLPTSVDNDVNALASGEMKFGAAKGLSTIVFLALGTGVGGAIAIDGEIHHGAHWSGGELGHLLLSMDKSARTDAGGSVGTLEAYCSGSGLVLTWREISDDWLSNKTAIDLAEEARQSPDGYGAQAGKKTGEYLGYGLASIINIIDPELIIIGGGLAAWGDLLLEPAREVVKRHSLRDCPVELARLGSDASVIGAASLAIH